MSFFKVTNSELELDLKTLVSQERRLLHKIIEYLREVDRRKIFLERARSSLFEYLVKDLGYSSSAAQRRVEAVRLSRDVPTLTTQLKEGSLNLTQIGELNRAIKQKQQESHFPISPVLKQNLVAKIACLDIAETQKVLSQELDLQLKPHETKRHQKDESVYMQITFTKEQFAKLNKCRDLTAHLFDQQNGSASLAQVIEVIAEQFIKEKKFIAVPATDCVIPESSKETKSITPRLRKEIFQEQKYCQYRDPVTDRVCGSTHRLEIDHIHPKWAGGSNEKKNLRLLCSNHNKFVYRRQSGFL